MVALMNTGEKAAESAEIRARISDEVSSLKPGSTILLFSPLPDEPDVRPLVKEFHNKEYEVVLPLVQGDTLLLKKYEPGQLSSGYKGIYEPKASCLDVKPENIDIAFIPGVGFDRKGRRMGRGKGFYDRLLPSLRCFVCGVCFSCQMAGQIPVEAHDVPVDKIITAMNNSNTMMPYVTGFNEIDKFNILSIECTPWPDAFPYKPKTTVQIAHSDKSILLRFNVREDGVRAVATEANGPVWKDSCAEFFFKLPDAAYYYNIETNCIGTCLAASRKSRNEDVNPLSDEQIGRIIRRSSLPAEPIDTHTETEWQLDIEIPFDLVGLDGKPESILCNFYKCGDKTAHPHYISWAPIDTEKPDFHRPEFFREIKLEW